jgi:UDP-N-acetylmuramoyl-L-alanyl-D-glutamate--2,6-diaminopimelate ligase
MPDMALIQQTVAWLGSLGGNARLSSDSRTVAQGDVFLAYPGDESDGRRYIADAIRKGAHGVIVDPDGFSWDDAWQTPHLPVPDLKQCAGFIAAAHHGQPDRDMFTVAITGTNGKTSCATWLATLLSRTCGSAASVGTLGVGLYKKGELRTIAATGYTTPDAVYLQNKLAELRSARVNAVAIEASSIGLDQGRMHGMHVDAALFTNLSRDHLDYHADMDAYETAKGKLFAWPGLAHAVMNLDDAASMRIVKQLKSGRPDVNLIGYSLTDQAVDGVRTLRARDLHSSTNGTTFHVDSPFGSGEITTRLAGRFNVANVLGVLGVLLAKGIAWKTAAEMIQTLEAAPGRMQQLGGQDAPLVVIDYAHTPDAIQQALAALRDVADERHGKLWCVFGCGGDRDPGKRPQMGQAAATGADHVVVTSDNPRSEEPGQIIRQVLDGIDAPAGPDAVQIVEDRAKAILWAIRHARRQDVILLAGKGHETTQEVHGKKLLFSDADHAALALLARATMKEPG